MTSSKMINKCTAVHDRAQNIAFVFIIASTHVLATRMTVQSKDNLSRVYKPIKRAEKTRTEITLLCNANVCRCVLQRSDVLYLDLHLTDE